MLKKVVTYSLAALAILLFCGYFAAASILSSKGREAEMCTDVKVTVLDSAINRFVSPSEIEAIIASSELNPVGKARKDADLHSIEKLLESRSAIRQSDVSLSRNGTLTVSITQRRPLLRIQSTGGAFYIDDTGYIFPWVGTFTSYVPVVSGHIPVRLKEGYRGTPEDGDKGWVDGMIELAGFLDRHPVWKAQIQQIDVEKNGDIAFYTVVGDQKIIFGGTDNIDYKFAKLKTFYRQIIPVYGWDRYSAVNLKFSDQIICTLRDNRTVEKSIKI